VIIVATPIYNYDANAAVKNLLELTGSSWEDKTVGFLCAAGGGSSYMSIMGLANSLMLDFRCLIIPRFVYAHGRDFVDGTPTPALGERIRELAAASVKIKNAV
jgi:NAD(P)H-dependent FMN reductase